MQKEQELILLDGMAYIFRAYFATLRMDLHTPDGFPTGAMYGTLNAITKITKDFPNAQLIAIFDHKGKNFRHDLFPEYKATRKPADEALKIQIDPLYEIIKAMGTPFLCVDGVEADDVIATLAIKADKMGIKTIIASGDKDLNQLVSDNVTQLDLKHNLIDPLCVVDKTGVRPDQINDYLALVGDASDNIPGVPKVGPKTAAKWLNEYNDIEGLMQNAESIKGKVGENLRNNYDQLKLSHELVKLKIDVEVDTAIFTQKIEPDTKRLAELYKKYGFSGFLNRIDQSISPK